MQTQTSNRPSTSSIRETFRRRMPDHAALFRKYNFFDLFPLDGGGYFVFMNTLGTLNDIEIADKLLSQPLKPWGQLGRLDYKAAVSWSEAELAMWIQRLYILPPLARAYWLSGNDAYKQAAMMHLKDWWSQNPFPADPQEYLIKEREKFESQGRVGNEFTRSWFDFQPATRVLFLAWSLYFMLDGLGDEDIDLFVLILKKHAEILLSHLDIWPEHVGNHASYWALALGYCGYLFKEDEIAKSCMDNFNKLIHEHYNSQIDADGLSREGSPSYMLFSAMQFREAYIISAANGATPVIPLSDIRKMYTSIEYLILPDGNCANVNDGYSGNAMGLLNSLQNIMEDFEPDPLKRKQLEVVSFKDSGYMVARTNQRKNSSYVMLDTTRPLACNKASHSHAGKLGIIYYSGGRLLIGDSGTGPYNQELFGNWFRRANAHSTIVIDDMEDADFISEWEWERLPDFKRSEPVVTESEACLSAATDGYMRLADPVGVTRQIRLKKDGSLQIKDSLEAKQSHTVQWIFRLPFKGFAQKYNNGIKVSGISLGNKSLWITPDRCDKTLSFFTKYEPYFMNNSIQQTTTIILKKKFMGNLCKQFDISLL